MGYRQYVSRSISFYDAMLTVSKPWLIIKFSLLTSTDQNTGLCSFANERPESVTSLTLRNDLASTPKYLVGEVSTVCHEREP
jgi:hypothetical protein